MRSIRERLVLSLLLSSSIAHACVEPGTCIPPAAQFSRVIPGPKPGQQWNINGGFCGSWSIQQTAKAFGAWISQDVVRKANRDQPIQHYMHGDEELGYEVVPSNQAQQVSILSARKVEAQIISRQCLDSGVLLVGNRSTHAKHFAQKQRPELAQPSASVGGIAATHTKQGGPPFGSNPNSGDSDFLHSL